MRLHLTGVPCTKGPAVETSVKRALAGKASATVEITEGNAPEVTGKIDLCDFDPIAILPQVVAAIGEAIYATLGREIGVSCSATGVPGASWERGAYTGFAG